MIRNGPAFTCLFLLSSVFHHFHRFMCDVWFKRNKIWFVISTATRLRPGGSGFRQKASSSPKRPNQAHTPSCLVCSVGYPPEIERLRSHFHQVSRLRSGGAIPPLHFYNFMTCIENTSHLPLKISGQFIYISSIRVYSNRDLGCH